MANWQASDEVMDFLACYRPRVLPRLVWKDAREQVVATVLAAEPRTTSNAEQLTSALVVFLADLAVWDRRSALDLPERLTREQIERFIARRKQAGTRASTLSQRQSALLRLMRGVQGLPIDERRAPGEATTAVFAGEPVGVVPASQVQALRALLAAGHPTTAAAVAWTAWSGRGVSSPLRHAVRVLVPAAGEDPLRTGGATVGHTLLQLPEVSTSGAPVVSTDPRTSKHRNAAAEVLPAGRTAPAKPMSRAAAVRHMRAQKAVLDELASQSRVETGFDEASLPREIVAVIDRYAPMWLPEEVWREVEELHRRLVLGYRPTSPGRVGNVASAVTAFLRYVHGLPGREAGPVTAEQVLVPGLLETYIATIPDATASSYRSLLRRCLDSLTPAASRARIGYTPRPAPYTPAECSRFVRVVWDQPSVGRRRAGCLIVGLGLGAGLDGRDWRALRRNHVREDTLADGTAVLVVDVPETSRPARTVVIRTLYEPLVRRGLAAHDEAGRGQQGLLLGEDEDRRSVLDGRIRALTTARQGAVDIDAARLRNTWLVAALSSSLPLPAVMAAAGLNSARTITDLLPYCAAPDPHAVASALAALPQTPLPVRADARGPKANA